MKCVLLALALVCGIQAIAIPQAMKDLKVEKMAGTWYTAAMAASHEALLDKDSIFRMFIKDVKVTPQKDMEITLSKQVNQACVEKRLMAQKTKAPAVFMVDYKGEKKVTVLNTDYTHHMVFCVEAVNDQTQQDIVCQYLTKTVNPEEKQVMLGFSRALQALPRYPQIILNMLQKQEQCRV